MYICQNQITMPTPSYSFQYYCPAQNCTLADNLISSKSMNFMFPSVLQLAQQKKHREKLATCKVILLDSEHVIFLFHQVDERAVLKHFDWPESKADALREAAFDYQDLMKLEKQVITFVDDPNLPCEAALERMYKLLEKYVQSSSYACSFNRL